MIIGPKCEGTMHIISFPCLLRLRSLSLFFADYLLISAFFIMYNGNPFD